MSKCTASQALERFLYWEGYYEKASSKYVKYTDKEYFDLDKGNANWTHAGYISGVNPGAWCAMQYGLSVYEACGSKELAKQVMGIWPYTVVKQIWMAADDDHRFYGDYQRFTLKKGSRNRYTPRIGDACIFTDDKGKTLTHVGMVYSVNDIYAYTIEGNSSNMCRKRSYLRDSAYIFGYVTPNWEPESSPVIVPAEQYGAICCEDPELHILSKGCAGEEVRTVQRICFSKGYKGEDGLPITADGDFGKNTKLAVKTMQSALGIESDGIVGAVTWSKMLKELK